MIALTFTIQIDSENHLGNREKVGQDRPQVDKVPPGIFVLKHSPQADMGYNFTLFIEMDTISDCRLLPKNKTPLGKIKT